MKIIKLDATESTNLYLKNLSSEKQLADYTTVMAEHQIQGRGQMGTSWQSEKGKNLTISVFKKHEGLRAKNQFAVSMCASLALRACLNQYQISDVFVKWPNDILSGQKKICGILIENVFRGSAIQSSILGIGLNVNQTDFSGIEKASSLILISGKAFDLEVLLNDLLVEIRNQFDWFDKNGFDRLRKNYEKVLFKRREPSNFMDANGQIFTGVIKGVSDLGKLKVEIEGKKNMEYGLKEISLVY